MVSFRHVRSKIRIAGFNCHHLIPLQVVEAREFAIFFGTMKSLGFSADDFCTNGMHLPCDEKTAYMIGRPIHRGGHPLYNQMVAEHISIIVRLPAQRALAAVHTLQSQLRSSLCVEHAGEPTIIRKPMDSLLKQDLTSIDILGIARLRMPRLT